LKKLACTILSVLTCLLWTHSLEGQTPESRKVEAGSAFNSGVQSYRSGDLQAAIDQFTRAGQLDPDLYVVDVYLGNAYGQLAQTPVLNRELMKNAIDAFQRALEKEPGMVDAVVGLASAYQIIGNLEKTREFYLRLTKLTPQNPTVYYTLASTDWLITRDKANPLPAADQMGLINEGLDNVDIALALNPRYQEAMAYKNLLLRAKAERVTDPLEHDALLKEADAWFNRALEVLKLNSSQTNTGITATPQDRGLSRGVPGGIGAPPPAPPAAIGGVNGVVPGGAGVLPPPSSQVPVRIGGDVANANLISSVAPTYPPRAREARTQGVVLLQVTIDKTGSVSDARVISGDPLLNEAALSAVRQWRYKPISMTGEPIVAITTVTVNFVVQQ